MKLLLVRHAESSNNVLGGMGHPGRLPDPTLTELGFDQAQALTRVWQDPDHPRPDIIYSSLMRRTIETIAPSAELLDLPIHAHERTFEIGGPYEGPWDAQRTAPGSPRSLLQSLTPRVVLPDSATESGWWHGGFEGEDERLARAQEVLDELRQRHGGQTVLLVSHGAFGNLLLRAATGSQVVMLQDNTGTTLLDEDVPEGRRPRLLWFNRTDHLRAE